MKTRFCPSPTGDLHLGNARTAIFNALYAAATEGAFLLRIEDTDQERSQPVFADQLMADLRWLGCAWQEGPDVGGDAGPYYQSERSEVYARYYEQLLENDLAYPCFATQAELALMRKLQRAQGLPPRYDGRYAGLTKAEQQEKIDAGTPYVLRLRIPDDAVIRFNDLVKGEQTFLGKDIGDFIIRREDGTPTFMFCNAIDDAMMGVTHALRGEDHLTNTPRQLWLLQALKLTAPTYGHFSLITEKDGTKLSKRSGGQSVKAIREQGYLPAAVLNYLSRLSHKYDTDAFLDDAALKAHFNVDGFSKSAAKFDMAQLNYWQKEAVMRLSDEEAVVWLAPVLAAVPADKHTAFAALMRANIMLPEEAAAWVPLLFEASLVLSDAATAVLSAADSSFFDVAHAAWEKENDLSAVMGALKASLGIKGKALFQPLRVALTGQLHGPELAPIVSLMGSDLVCARLNARRA